MPDLNDIVIFQSDPLAHLTLDRAISLRWALRDILAGRTKFLPLADTDLKLLINMGMVEMQGDEPKLTDAGLAVIK